LSRFTYFTAQLSLGNKNWRRTRSHCDIQYRRCVSD